MDPPGQLLAESFPASTQVNLPTGALGPCHLGQDGQIVAAGSSPHQVADRVVLDRPTRLLRELEWEFPGLWALVQAQVDGMRAGNSWPDWSLYPMNAIQLMVFMSKHPDVAVAGARSPEEGEALFARYRRAMGLEERREQLTLSSYIAAGAHWRLGRGIYRFDPSLQASVLATPLNDELPVDLLFRLPEWGVYVDLDAGVEIGMQRFLGFFAHLEYDIFTKRPELRLVWLFEDPSGDCSWSPSSFSLRAASMGEAREMMRGPTQAINDGPLEESEELLWTEAITVTLNSIVYLCSQGADISRRHHPEQRPERAVPKHTKAGYRFVTPGGPSWWEVGYRVGRALRTASEALAVDDSSGSDRRGPAPHLRRAHWHLYWTGAGRRTPEVRWLHPILVGQRDDHELPPTVRRVQPS